LTLPGVPSYRAGEAGATGGIGPRLGQLEAHDAALLAAERDADERDGDAGIAVFLGLALGLELGEGSAIGHQLDGLEREEVDASV
jgi:hypothetical protein